jgi:hypothetical protein
MQSDKVLTTPPLKNGKPMPVVNTVAVLSIIGSAFWGIVFFILFIGCLINGAALMESLSMDNVFSGVIFLFAVMSLLIMTLCAFTIVGAIQLKKGLKKGFKFYAIGNIPWVLIMLYASNGSIAFIVVALISAVFVMIMGGQRKLMQ